MGLEVKLLLDSCVFIWLTQSPDQISARAKRAIDDTKNQLLLSHASVWEIHLKHHAGKLTLPEPPRSWLAVQMARWAIVDWPVDLESVHLTSDLPPIHKDPFDRLLAAQSRAHDFTLISPDDCFRQYGAKVLW